MKLILLACLCLCFSISAFAHGGGSGKNFVRIEAHNSADRSKIANLGIAIDSFVSDSVYATVSDKYLEKLKNSDLKILESYTLQESVSTLDFPVKDARFHNYKEMTSALDDLEKTYSKIMKKSSIGKTLEGREIWAMHITSSAAARNSNSEDTFAAKPGIVFMGNHHAREHVSAEIPLMLIEFLGKNYDTDTNVKRLVDTRDIYIIPMVNPDGVEYDISTGKYKSHRKNMRKTADDGFGVDLNRNYDYKWGGQGASADPESETYRGPNAFSEPETQAIRDFVVSHPNLNVLLSFHTFSELILYPWGYRKAGLDNNKDKAAFVAMANKMAGWNNYTPEQSSELYIACGDTVDWAYGWSLTNRSSRIFAFTFELSPKDMWFSGGFYPGAGVLDTVFQANLKPALYLIDLADDPYRATASKEDPRLSWLN